MTFKIFRIANSDAYLFELLGSFSFLLIQLLSCNFIGWVLKIRSEELEVLFLGIIVLSLNLGKLSLFDFHLTSDYRREFTVEVLESSLRSNLTDLNQGQASLTQLSDSSNSEIFTLTSHSFKEKSEVLWDFFSSNQVLGYVACI